MSYTDCRLAAVLGSRLKEPHSCLSLDMTFFTCVHLPLGSPAIRQSTSHKANEAEMYTPTGGTKGHVSVDEDLHTRKQLALTFS